jgi:hypothetical protein
VSETLAAYVDGNELYNHIRTAVEEAAEAKEGSGLHYIGYATTSQGCELNRIDGDKPSRRRDMPATYGRQNDGYFDGPVAFAKNEHNTCYLPCNVRCGNLY